MIISAQIRAARAYLDWSMNQAAAASGLHRRTILRLEKGGPYIEGQPASLEKLAAVYRAEGIILDRTGLKLVSMTTEWGAAKLG
jgi:transcriptional regulator with XRE-family HTH domain